VGKAVLPHDGLPSGDLPVGRPGDVLRYLPEAFSVDTRVYPQKVLGGHDDLLQGGIAGPLANAHHGGAQECGAGLHAGDGVGGGHPEIVVGVHLDRDVDVVNDVLNGIVGHRGGKDAQSIAVADPVRTRLLGGSGELQQELRVGAGGVLGIDRYVQAVSGGVLHRLHYPFKDPLAALHQLMLDMDVG